MLLEVQEFTSSNDPVELDRLDIFSHDGSSCGGYLLGPAHHLPLLPVEGCPQGPRLPHFDFCLRHTTLLQAHPHLLENANGGITPAIATATNILDSCVLAVAPNRSVQWLCSFSTSSICDMAWFYTATEGQWRVSTLTHLYQLFNFSSFLIQCFL